MDDLSSGRGDQRLSGEQAEVDIVIVNWNSGHQLAECLDSIRRYGGESVTSVAVVDNGSKDDSLQRVNAPDLPLTVLKNSENRGFAAACNQGAALGFSPYVLFLNPDARLMDGALPRSLDVMESPEGEDIGILGVRLVDEEGDTSRHCARFPTWRTFFGKAIGLTRVLPQAFPPHFMTDFDHLTSRNVDQVIGAFFLVRRNILEDLKGFDERFFVYFEELDFSLRARQAGWRTRYLAEALSYHKGGGASEKVKAFRLFFSVRSRIYYALKHFHRFEAWIVVFTSLLIEPVSRVLRAVLKGSAEETRDVIRAYKMLWYDLPRILRTAREAKNE